MENGMITYEQLANELAIICNGIMEFRGKNLASLSTRDARHVCLYGFQTAIGAVAISVKCLTTERTPSKVDEIINRFVHGDDLRPRKLLEDSWKFLMIALPHFRMDNFFQNVLRALGEDPGKTGFGANAKAELDKITLADRQHCQQVLSTWTHIRNSLHNNGVHRGSDFRYTIRGLDFEFEQNAMVNCADIINLLSLLHEGIQCAQCIILTPEIRNLATIEDLSIELRYPMQ